MAQGDVTLSRRDARALLAQLETIERHHTKRLDTETLKVLDPAFPHDAETHEDDARDCPQCEVLESVFALRRLLTPVQEDAGEPRKVVTITAKEAQAIEDKINGRVKPEETL